MNPAPAAPGGPKLAPPPRPPSVLSRLRHVAIDRLPSALLVRSVPNAGKRVALTFDDGPHELTEAYLDVLERFSAKATFFLVGEACRARPEAVLHIVQRGHEVAGHGLTHKTFPSLSATALRTELDATAALLPPSETGRRLVRPPRGAVSLVSLGRCARAGYVTILWSRDSDDCRVRDRAELEARLAPEVLSPGEIVLLHEGQDWTLAALPGVLGRLRDAGYEAVTVGNLLGW